LATKDRINLNVADSSGLPADLVSWIRSETHASELTIERQRAGGSRAGFAVDVVENDGSVQRLWLRLDLGVGPLSQTPFTLQREATVYRALQSTNVRVPELIAVHPTLEAFLMRRVEGRNWFVEIEDPAERESVASDFMHQLGEIHAIDPLDLELPGFGKPKALSEHILDEIDLWEDLHRQGVAELDPIVLTACSWLRGHVPPDGTGEVVFTQGDTGPGNFMFKDGRVTAVLDWENAHFGDFHDDLAWIYVRDLQERFTHLPTRLAEYQAITGRTVDLERLKYFIVLAQMRAAVGTLNAVESKSARGEIANHLIYGALHLRMLAEALGQAAGVGSTHSFEMVAESAEATEFTWLFDVALDELREVIVPELSGNDFALRRGKGLARIVKVLRDYDRSRDRVERAERADLEALLGTPCERIDIGRRLLCAAISKGEISELDCIGYGLRNVDRKMASMSMAMGSLAKRHFSPIEVA